MKTQTRTGDDVNIGKLSHKSFCEKLAMPFLSESPLLRKSFTPLNDAVTGKHLTFLLRILMDKHTPFMSLSNLRFQHLMPFALIKKYSGAKVYNIFTTIASQVSRKSVKELADIRLSQTSKEDIEKGTSANYFLKTIHNFLLRFSAKGSRWLLNQNTSSTNLNSFIDFVSLAQSHKFSAGNIKPHLHSRIIKSPTGKNEKSSNDAWNQPLIKKGISQSTAVPLDQQSPQKVIANKILWDPFQSVAQRKRAFSLTTAKSILSKPFFSDLTVRNLGKLLWSPFPKESLGIFQNILHQNHFQRKRLSSKSIDTNWTKERSRLDFIISAQKISRGRPENIESERLETDTSYFQKSRPSIVDIPSLTHANKIKRQGDDVFDIQTAFQKSRPSIVDAPSLIHANKIKRQGDDVFDIQTAPSQASGPGVQMIAPKGITEPLRKEGDIDVEELTNRVIKNLENKLKTEQERRGIFI